MKSTFYKNFVLTADMGKLTVFDQKSGQQLSTLTLPFPSVDFICSQSDRITMAFAGELFLFKIAQQSSDDFTLEKLKSKSIDFKPKDYLYIRNQILVLDGFRKL